MDLIKFKNKYKTNGFGSSDFPKDWEKLLINCHKNNILDLCFNTLLEERFPYLYLKEIIDYDENSKSKILNNNNAFKWACAFGSSDLIKYLDINAKQKDIPGAVNSAIIYHRLENLLLLDFLGYEKEIYTENNFVQALKRSNISGHNLDIVEYFFKKIDKLPYLTTYWNCEVEKQDWISWFISTNKYDDLLEIYLKLESSIINEKIINKSSEFMQSIMQSGKVHWLEKLINTTRKEDFIQEACKTKQQWLLNNFSLEEKNKETIDYILDKYPQILKHKDIKLWMMNINSLNINEFIQEKRTIKNQEIKTSFIKLSNNIKTIGKLLELYPDYDFSVFKIIQAIKISNNLYESKEDLTDNYHLNSEYMTINRKILLSNNEFKENKNQLKYMIKDKKMFDMLLKEQMKNEFELQFPPKENVNIKKAKPKI